MRAPLTHAAARAPCPDILFVFCAVTLCFVSVVNGGYYAENGYQDDAIDVVDLNATCPTERVLRVRDICRVDGVDIQCIKLRCCDTHVYISGRCIEKTIDPCSLMLCEQECTVKEDKLWCTCYPGYRYHAENHRKMTQPYCVDVDECAYKNGGCSHTCINEPGRYRCECPPQHVLASDARTCVLKTTIIVEPLPLTRASSRCFAPCDTVSRLMRKVDQLSGQLHSTQSALKKVMDGPKHKGEGGERFAEGNYMYRVLDATAPLEGGYCRCERGQRGPPGAPGMEGPKGSTGTRGPRGAKGPPASLDLMLLLLADLRHDIHNLEKEVYKDGPYPERFNLHKARKYQRKQEAAARETRTEQALEAYTALPGHHGRVEVTLNSVTGEIPHEHESTTDWNLVKGETESAELEHLRQTFEADDMDAKLMQFHLLVNSTKAQDEDEEDFTDYDYTFY